MNDGETMQFLVKKHHLGAVGLIDKLKGKISQGKFYSLYKDKKIEEPYLTLLKEAGIDIKGNMVSSYSNSMERAVPYYNIEAHAGNMAIFKEAKPEYVTGYIKGTDFDGIDMFIGVQGDSMYPKYQAGDQIGLRRIKDFSVIAFGEAHVIVTDEQVLLKYLRKGIDKHHWSLVSEHANYDPIEIAIDKVLFLFIVKNKITKKVMG